MDSFTEILIKLPTFLMTMSFDKYLTAIIANNWVTLTSLLGFLKGMATLSKNNTDDKIVSFLENLVGIGGKEAPKPEPIFMEAEIVDESPKTD